MDQLTPFLGGSALVSLIGILVWLVARLIRGSDATVRQQAELIVSPMRNEIQSLKEDNEKCNRRVAILTNAMVRANIQIPEEFWRV